jgi:ParB-like chromosome segregation protein Spo0J
MIGEEVETRTIIEIPPGQEIEDHPISALIGPVTPLALAYLTNRIAEQGMVTEICLYQGKILDGRTRYRACKALGIPCRAWEYRGDAPYEQAIALNIHDRQLTPSQRAIYGVQMSAGLIEEAEVRMRSGRRLAREPLAGGRARVPGGKTSAHLARLVSIGERLMDDALSLVKNYPEYWEHVLSGELTVQQAHDLAMDRPPRAHKSASAPVDVTIAPIPGWEVPRPKGKSVLDWRRAFNAQAQRARSLPLEGEHGREEALGGAVPDDGCGAGRGAHRRYFSLYSVESQPSASAAAIQSGPNSVRPVLRLMV